MRPVASTMLSICAALAPAHGQEPQAPDRPVESVDELADLSLEELMNIEVSLVSRRSQRKLDAPAAVFVLTRRDIERSGLFSIPELLRLVPGVQVQRLDSSRYAISARGFASQYANKLLVQMDGRSVYTPAFSGVYWDLQDLVLDDIERIEVIRGPGGANWGANAVNGVVNVVTRKAGDAPGGYSEALVGTEDRSIFALRYAGALSDDVDFRISGKWRQLDESRNAFDQPSGDTVKSGLLDFRVDGRSGPAVNWMLRGGLSAIDNTSNQIAPILVPPFEQQAIEPTRATAGHLLGRVELNRDGGAATQVQFYYDAFEREERNLFQERRHTFDLDLQHGLAPLGDHRLTVGASYRATIDDLGGYPRITFTPESDTRQLAGIFGRDDWSLTDDLRAHLGIKLEYNDFTGLEPQPELRLSWAVAAETLVWASVARAVRIPSRVEDAALLDYRTEPGPGGIPVLTQITPNRGLAAEVLIAYELGIRGRIADSLVGDVSLFYNDYDEIIGYALGAPVPGPPPALILPATTSNALGIRAYGLEASLDWLAHEDVLVTAGYSYLEQDITASSQQDIVNPIGYGGFSRHQGSLRIMWTPVSRLELGLQAFYVDRLRIGDVPAYTRLDISASWRADSRTRLMAGAQNLLDDRRPEGRFDFGYAPVEIERAFYVQVAHSF